MIGELAQRTFHLDQTFLDAYRGRQPQWGPLGWVTYLRTYSRRLSDGRRETYFDTVQRCVEGCLSIQKNYCHLYSLPWKDEKAQRTAQRMFQAMWEFKFLPAGRGLWAMGTDHIVKCGSASLNNCGFVTTEYLSSRHCDEPFTFVMDMMMVGVGVGFDLKGAQKLSVNAPFGYAERPWIVEDSREGWVQSVKVLLDSYLGDTKEAPIVPTFDYNLIRPSGQPLMVFGGVSAGPGPLMTLHSTMRALLNARVGSKLTSTDILDLMNIIGLCVNSGNIRRGAEIALGSPDDTAFLDAKLRRGADAIGHRAMSNNSIFAAVGMNYGEVGWRSATNGEPGYFWLENARKYGRLKDGVTNIDYRAMGCNPCNEQTLENLELCNLVETYPSKHTSLNDYLDTLKLAYLWAKTVSLLPTHYKETNAVTLRNRRIGCSQSGIVNAFTRHGRREMLRWCDEGYAFVLGLDKQYSSWLCVPESIKKTSVKPSGTVSLLAGETPGIHYPQSEFYIRRIRIAANDPLIPTLEEAGYPMEADLVVPSTVVVSFPIHEPWFDRDKSQVSMWEQLENVAAYQHYWADNQVSATITVSESERRDIPRALELYESRLKAVSFLPLLAGDHYPQMPYETVTDSQYQKLCEGVTPIKQDREMAGEGQGARFCDTDQCAT